MIGAFVGQQIPPLEAAACAVWLHGAAGDVCAKEIGQYGMLPSDILQRLPRLMK
jgi:NAD(P)H-hydrate epimerase